MTNNTMTTNEEIVFDANCGISEEEQREIFAQINNIAEKNRLSLAASAATASVDGGIPRGKGKKKKRFKAKKSGGLFPLVVNAAAIAALAGGFLALYVFQGKTDAEVREGAKVYNSAERALIDEIRRETSSRLEDKENEISKIASQLEGVDAELRDLHSSAQELTAEQQAAEDRLRAMREEYRAMLANLQDERSVILEEARAREANLQAQLESRTRELAMVSEQSAAAIDIAQGELERLSREQAQAASVEAQMGAFFATLTSRINENRLDEAAEILVTMRAFLNTPAFMGLRSIQARRDLYVQAINSFDTMIDELRRNQAALATGVMSLDRSAEATFAQLQEKNAQLERDLAERNRRITEMERTLQTSSSASASAAQNATALERRVETLHADVARESGRANSLQEQVNTRDNTIRTQTATIANRNDCLEQIQNVIRGRSIADMTIGELSDSLSRIQNALQSLN
jgi:peptidoglycan hydrolase CwlO-like protein